MNAQYVDPTINNEYPYDLDHEELARLFSAECGLQQLPFMARGFRAMLAEGFEPRLLQQAICRTAMAPRPSWAYLEGILNNCRISGIYDELAFVTKRHDAYQDEPSPLDEIRKARKRQFRGV